ncbi:amidohydrolase family protein [Alsobacter sp. KACC 23698]|uniref:Amidohydrolase family protein n=1 Tax=Alsobacter sp. KACC 23698 TaxID=3149229 RepID=A0AAU7JJ21_9HYPH
MSRLHLTNLRLLDVREGASKPGFHVTIKGDRIVDVSDGPLDAGDGEIVDLQGRVLMPGLIDCHVHVNAVQLNLAPTRQLPASLVTAGAARIMRGMLMRGFTTVRDAGGADRGLKLAVEQGLFAGPRLYISGRAISQTGGHGDFRPQIDQPDPGALDHLFDGIGRIADGVPEVRRAARDEIRLGADHIKIMASGGVASMADPIDFLQYSDEELDAFVDEARRARTYVMAHAYTADAIARCLRAGVRSIEHANLIDEETADLMVARGAYMVPTLVTYDALAREGRALGFSEVGLHKLQQVLDVGTKSLEIAKAAGVKMAYGTDLLGDLHRLQSDEFRIRSAVLSAADIIRSATQTGAELIGMAGQLGVIAPGAFADLLVVDGDPLEDLGLLQEQGRSLRAIIQGGKFVKNELRA